MEALAFHDASKFLGKLSSGTLRLTEDNRGLRAEVDLPDTTVGRDVRELIQRGDITAGSFGMFDDTTKTITRREQDTVIHELHDIDAFEVSVLTRPPAYPATEGTVNVRSLDEWVEQEVARADKAKALKLRMLENRIKDTRKK